MNCRIVVTLTARTDAVEAFQWIAEQFRLEPLKLQLIKLGLSVGLRPEADLAGTGERRVVNVQQLHAVLVADDVIAFHGHSKVAPSARVGGHGALELGALRARTKLSVTNEEGEGMIRE